MDHGTSAYRMGTEFAWNLTDLLNPFNPGAIELNERSDTDAVNANITQGPLSRTELADSIRRAMGRSSLCHPQGYQYI